MTDYPARRTSALTALDELRTVAEGGAYRDDGIYFPTDARRHALRVCGALSPLGIENPLAVGIPEWGNDEIVTLTAVMPNGAEITNRCGIQYLNADRTAATSSGDFKPLLADFAKRWTTLLERCNTPEALALSLQGHPSFQPIPEAVTTTTPAPVAKAVEPEDTGESYTMAEAGRELFDARLTKSPDSGDQMARRLVTHGVLKQVPKSKKARVYKSSLDRFIESKGVQAL
jgi:hypothetical protein